MRRVESARRLEPERQLSQLEGPNGVEVPGEFLIGVGTK
jgi:hypothetical protein